MFQSIKSKIVVVAFSLLFALGLADTITHVRRAIQRFVKGAPQSDDITMMVLEFHRAKKSNAK